MSPTPLTILAPIQATAASRERIGPSGRLTELAPKKRVVRKLGERLDACVRASNGDTAASSASAPRHSDPRALDGICPEATREFNAVLAAEIVHTMGLFVVDPDEDHEGYVGLEANVDGSARAFCDRLAGLAPNVLRTLFAGCDGFDPSADRRALAKYLLSNRQVADAAFVAFPGKPLKQIQGEQALRVQARAIFEEGRRSPGALGLPASDRSAPREAPSSASAAWEHIRERLADHPLVREGSTRPFGVRWSLAMGGLVDHLNLWGLRLFSALLSATAIVWVVAPFVPILGRARAAGAPLLTPHRLEPAAVAVVGFALTGLIVSAAWAREAPKALNVRGRWTVLRAGISTWLWSGATCAAVLVLVDFGFRLAQALHAGGSARGIPGFAGIAVLAGLLFLGGARVLGWVGLGLSTPALLGLLLLDAAALLPVADLPELVSGAVVVVGSLFLLPVAGFSYAMDGAAGCVAEVAGLVGLWLTLAWVFFDRPLALLGAGYGVLTAVVVLGAARLAWWLSQVRRAEAAENAAVAPPVVADVEHLEAVEAPEDRELQNHLVIVSRLKDGALRLRTLERVLRAVSVVARFYAVRGDLGGIRTIHFAQFLILKKSRPTRLLFLSNYDSAFGSYLQEFNSVIGVTAVWSNCVGFPPAFGLVGDGANDEQRFKQFGRHDQIPTLGWFGAYTDLFIRDIETATDTRETLRRRLVDPSTWKGRQRAQFGRPLSEADCDAILQRL